MTMLKHRNQPWRYRLAKGVLAAFVLWATILTVHALLSLHDEPNASTDGRYHTCGYVTEDGVTEHLAEYWERCGITVEVLVLP